MSNWETRLRETTEFSEEKWNVECGQWLMCCLVALFLCQVSNTIQLQEDPIMRIWATWWTSNHTNSEGFWVFIRIRWIWRGCQSFDWIYPWCHFQHSSSLLAELLATVKQLFSDHWGTNASDTFSPRHSAFVPVIRKTYSTRLYID